MLTYLLTTAGPVRILAEPQTAPAAQIVDHYVGDMLRSVSPNDRTGAPSQGLNQTNQQQTAGDPWSNVLLFVNCVLIFFFFFFFTHCYLLLFFICKLRLSVFTARCTLVQSAVLRSHVVCLSVRPSVRPSVCGVGEL